MNNEGYYVLWKNSFSRFNNEKPIAVGKAKIIITNTKMGANTYRYLVTDKEEIRLFSSRNDFAYYPHKKFLEEFPEYAI